MMLLPAASAPPAVVVKVNVAAAELFPATRSDAAIANETSVTCPPITPELTPADTSRSALVATVTPVALPAVATPMVKPVKVTVTALLALIAWVAVVMTMEVPVGVATEPVGPLPLICALGDPALAKKPDAVSYTHLRAHET